MFHPPQDPHPQKQSFLVRLLRDLSTAPGADDNKLSLAAIVVLTPMVYAKMSPGKCQATSKLSLKILDEKPDTNADECDGYGAENQHYEGVRIVEEH